jgi:(S)-3,5-dihydroxyphenylglycine transaminase
MNFLNEVVLDNPDAISFAPGRPPDDLLEVEQHVVALGEDMNGAGIAGARTWNALGQYNRTNGIINELIARQLQLDERIEVAPEAIMMTVGAQEAMAIILMGVFEPASDILLVSDPTYIGITGLARILGVRVIPVETDADGIVPERAEEVIVCASRSGRVRALYDIPDFNNPLGTTLPWARRSAVLDICRRHDVLLIEDNPYGMFCYDGERLPTLKALDTSRSVLYVGSFSKTIFPALRLGYIVADQAVASSGLPLARELSRVKSLLTVNTSPLAQAIAAAALSRAGGSLKPLVAPKRARLRTNRDNLLGALAAEFGAQHTAVRWNHPRGGFFVTVTLPFDFGLEELRRCSADFGVVVCPMQFFSIGSDQRRVVRLAFSSVATSDIAPGIARFAAFVRSVITAPPAHKLRQTSA